MTIKEIRLSIGLTQKQFAEYFDIPQRTVQEWEQERRIPPEYIPKLIERVWNAEKRQE